MLLTQLWPLAFMFPLEFRIMANSMIFFDDVLLWPLILFVNVTWVYWAYLNLLGFDFSEFLKNVILLPSLFELSYPALVVYMAIWKTYINGYDWANLLFFLAPYNPIIYNAIMTVLFGVVLFFGLPIYIAFLCFSIPTLNLL